MPNRPTLMGALIYMEDEYTKSDKKLELKESGKEGLKTGKLSNGRNYSVRDNRKRYFFPNEWYDFMKTLTTDKQKITADMLINTGARITEAKSVLVKDIDFEKQTMTIRRTKIKSAKGETKPVPRTIKLSTDFTLRLIAYTKYSGKEEIGMLSNVQARTMIKRKCKEAGIKDYYNFSPHNFRKTHGNWLKALKVDGLEICQRLGHDMDTFNKNYGSSDVFSKEEKIEIRKIVGDLYE